MKKYLLVFGLMALTTTTLASIPVKKDADKDNVMDSTDKCLKTTKGIAVDTTGCPIDETAKVIMKINFSFGKAEIDRDYNKDLKDIAAFMALHPETKVEIQGHTDDTGSLAINKKLSQERADSVKVYLADKLNVNESRITTEAHGEAAPLASNVSSDGKAENRRAMAIITVRPQ